MKKGTTPFLPLCGLAVSVALTLFSIIPVEALPNVFSIQIEVASRPGQCLAIDNNSNLVLSKSCDASNNATFWTFLTVPNTSFYQIENAGQPTLALSQGRDYTSVATADNTQTNQQWQVGAASDPSQITTITSVSDNQPIGIDPNIGTIRLQGQPLVIRLSKVRVGAVKQIKKQTTSRVR
jgi:hypothetical protein